MIRFAAMFALVGGALFAAELLEPVRAALIVPWTELLATVTGGLLALFDADVATSGVVIRSAANGFAVAIQPGCNGVEACIVLAAAVTAFPAPWAARIAGMAAGFLAIQSLNLVRLASLFYLGQWSRELFEWAHLYLWQALIMLDALVVFVLWLRFLPPGAAAAPPRAGAAA